MLIDCILTALVYAVAGMVQGLTGFGSAVVAIPVMTMYLDVQVAVPASILMSYFINIPVITSYRGFTDREKVMPLLLGALPGIACGVYFLANFSEEPLKLGISLFLIAYALYGLFLEKPRRNVLGPRWGYLAGFITGGIAGAFSMGGPPAIIYAAMTGWPKNVIKGTLGVFFILGSTAIVAGHASQGLINWDVVILAAVSGPAVWFGTKAGIRFSDHFDERAYRRLLFLMVLVMGIMMLAATA